MGSRYVNRQKGPIRVTGKNGTRQVFHPGQGTSEPWFSRYCANGVLTEETTDGQPVHRVRTKAHPELRVQHKSTVGSVIPATPKRVSDPPSPDGMALPYLPSGLGIENGCVTKCEGRTESISKGVHTIAVGDVIYCRYCDINNLDPAFMDEHVRRDHPAKVAATEVAIQAKAEELVKQGHPPDPPALDPPGIVEIVPVPPAVIIIVPPEPEPELSVEASPKRDRSETEADRSAAEAPPKLGVIKPEEEAFLKDWFETAEHVSGGDIAELLELSRQEAAQRLTTMCTAGWLERTGTPKNTVYELTQAARDHLWPI